MHKGRCINDGYDSVYGIGLVPASVHDDNFFRPTATMPPTLPEHLVAPVRQCLLTWIKRRTSCKTTQGHRPFDPLRQQESSDVQAFHGGSAGAAMPGTGSASPCAALSHAARRLRLPRSYHRLARSLSLYDRAQLYAALDPERIVHGEISLLGRRRRRIAALSRKGIMIGRADDMSVAIAGAARHAKARRTGKRIRSLAWRRLQTGRGRLGHPSFLVGAVD